MKEQLGPVVFEMREGLVLLRRSEQASRKYPFVLIATYQTKRQLDDPIFPARPICAQWSPAVYS